MKFTDADNAKIKQKLDLRGRKYLPAMTAFLDDRELSDVNLQHWITGRSFH
jgi:hypothetical protein